MQDPQIELQLIEAREMKEMWQLFHEFFKLGISGEPSSAQNEARFLSVKSRIAMLHESFISTLKADRQVGQNMMQIVARCITLRHIARMTDVDIKKMNIEWHEAFLLLNSSIGELEEKIERLGNINPYAYHLGKVKERIVTGSTNFLKSGGFRIVAIVGSIVVAFVAFNSLGGPEFMRDTPALTPLYDFFADNHRYFVNPDAPFRNIDRMWRNARSLPDGFEDRGDVEAMARDEVERRMVRPFKPPVYAPGILNLGPELAKAPDFQAKSVRYTPGSGPGAGTLQVYTYRYDTTYEAREIVRKFTEWRKNLSEDSTRTLDDQIRVLRSVNCIILIHGGSVIMRDRMLEETFRHAEKTTL